MAMTGRVMPFKAGFGPFAPEVYTIGSPYCYWCPIGKTYPECATACADLLRELFVKEVSADSVACLVVELVLGEGGFIVPPKAYIQKIKAICEEHGIVFVADEIQSRIGRTGKMFAIEHFDVVPDLITTANSLAAGMPIAAVVAKRKIMDSVDPGDVRGLGAMAANGTGHRPRKQATRYGNCQSAYRPLPGKRSHSIGFRYLWQCDTNCRITSTLRPFRRS